MRIPHAGIRFLHDVTLLYVFQLAVLSNMFMHIDQRAKVVITSAVYPLQRAGFIFRNNLVCVFRELLWYYGMKQSIFERLPNYRARKCCQASAPLDNGCKASWFLKSKRVRCSSIQQMFVLRGSLYRCDKYALLSRLSTSVCFTGLFRSVSADDAMGKLPKLTVSEHWLPRFPLMIMSLSAQSLTCLCVLYFHFET